MKTMLSVIGPLWVIVHAILAAVNLYLGEIGWFFAHLTLSFIHVLTANKIIYEYYP
jgi:uncharacterized membrane protein